MAKHIITFGSNQIPEYPGNPMSIMLVIEAESDAEAREPLFKDPFHGRFCTSYPYDEFADDFKRKYNMVEITLDDLLKEMGK